MSIPVADRVFRQYARFPAYLLLSFCSVHKRWPEPPLPGHRNHVTSVNRRTTVLSDTSPFPLSNAGCNLLPISTAHCFRSGAVRYCTVTVCVLYGPVTRSFSGRDEGTDFLAPQFIVTESGVVSAVCCGCPDFSVCLPDKTRESF